MLNNSRDSRIRPVKAVSPCYVENIFFSKGICLGLLTNVNRNVTIENTRRHIGMGLGWGNGKRLWSSLLSGIRLACSDGGVLLVCLIWTIITLHQFPFIPCQFNQSESAVFCQVHTSIFQKIIVWIEVKECQLQVRSSANCCLSNSSWGNHGKHRQ